MAKIECELHGDFDDILKSLHNAVMDGSTSVSFEESSDFRTADMRCAVRSYERYSMLGKGRVSLTFTLVQANGKTFVSAISSGGSQAVFFKINTIGENNFLNTLDWAIDMYTRDPYE